MRNVSRLSLTVIAVFLLGSGVAIGVPMASTTDTQPVLRFSDGGDTGGLSHLTRFDDRLLLVIEGAEVEPNHVYTIWWIVFNNPAGCSHPCGEDDIFNADGSLNVDGVIAAEIGIGNATGNVAKANGTIEFGAELTQDTNDDHQVLFPAALGTGGQTSVLSEDPDGVEMHGIVQTHGQGRGGPQLLKQLSEVFFGCTPGCADIQFAVHLP